MKYHLLIIAIIFAAIAFAFDASAQTCQDGCFYSNTYQGQDALINYSSGGNDSAFGVDALTNNTGADNTALGAYAMLLNTTGVDNTAVGYNALYNSNGAYFNCAIGVYALFSDTTGANNTATGSYALYTNTTGGYNTANGEVALFSNTTGTENTAVGYEALYYNNGSGNTANGVNALEDNTTGSYNTAVGEGASFYNTTGTDNCAIGQVALYSDTDASYNTAVGEAAMYYNNGSNNTAIGWSAINKNTSGSSNTGAGYQALYSNTNGSSNTALGNNAHVANTSGSNNIAIGVSAGTLLTTGSNNIDIGANVQGNAGEANTIRIGKSGTQKKTFIAGITGTTVAGGVGVIIGSNGQLGTIVSSARFKEAIEPMDKASEAILALKPVTFRYKKELDPDGIPQFGLVAEDVEKVDPNLVARDEQGKPFTVRYEAVNAMLLNEFLKEHRTVQELKNEIAGLTATVKEQAAQIRRVSERIEASKAAPQLVARDR